MNTALPTWLLLPVVMLKLEWGLRVAYVCDIDIDFDATPFRDAMGAYIVEFALGYDLNDNEVAVMAVMLVPYQGYLSEQISGVYDLMFGIQTRPLDRDDMWAVSTPDFTVESTDRYIESSQRHVVLDCLMTAVRGLIDNVAPDHVTMVTYYPNLPKKAMRKFDRVVETIRSCGYELIDDFTDTNNRKHYWYLKKPG